MMASQVKPKSATCHSVPFIGVTVRIEGKYFFLGEVIEQL